MQARSYRAGCHCGAIGWEFRTTLEPSSWVIRACQCSFCRAHATRCTSDPMGSVEYSCRDSDAVVRYRFGLRTADFVLCGRCGVYLGAVIQADGGHFSTCNVNTLDTDVGLLGQTQPMRYQTEDASERRQRRVRNWTPVSRYFVNDE